MQERFYFIYILTNKRRTTLYTGVTNNLLNRAWQHKTKIQQDSFTARYNLDHLVYYEAFNDVYDALAREKQIKAGSRMKKIALIESINPEWNDLSDLMQ